MIPSSLSRAIALGRGSGNISSSSARAGMPVGVDFRSVALQQTVHHGYHPSLHLCCRPRNLALRIKSGRSIEGVIGSGALSVFSTPLGKECKDEDRTNEGVEVSLAFDGKHAGVLAAGVVSEEMGDPILLWPYSSGAELGTAADTCFMTKQADHCAGYSPSAPHPLDELEMGPSMGVACSGAGLDASVDASNMEFKFEMGDDDIAAPGWLDDTHAMLGAIDAPNSERT